MAKFDIAFNNPIKNSRDEILDQKQAMIEIEAKDSQQALERAKVLWYLTASFPDGISKGSFNSVVVDEKETK